MRFYLDECVPAGVATFIRQQHHDVWTAHDAHLEALSDEEQIIYSQDQHAVLVTNNRNCARRAQRMVCARAVWLRVVEADAMLGMARALDWLGDNTLPDGMVLEVPKTADVRVLSPLPRT